MEHLIDSAKQKLWDIVNDLAKVQPTPNLRVALYSYGATNYDAAKGWVKKDLDFVDDLDLVFKRLFEYRTNGGDEYVGRVAGDAIRDLKWSEAKDSLKILFVCATNPLRKTRSSSCRRSPSWPRKTASSSIPSTAAAPTTLTAAATRVRPRLAAATPTSTPAGNVKVVLNTPFDKDIAALADKVNATYVPVGKKEVREAKAADQKAQTENAKQLGGRQFGGPCRCPEFAALQEFLVVPGRQAQGGPEARHHQDSRRRAAGGSEEAEAGEAASSTCRRSCKSAGDSEAVNELNTRRDAYIREETRNRSTIRRGASTGASAKPAAIRRRRRGFRFLSDSEV